MSATQVLELRQREVRMLDVMDAVNGSGADYRMRPVPHVDLTYKITGAAMKVHGRMGPGLKEAFYQRELSAELAKEGLDVVAEQAIEISIDGRYVGQLYIDHLVEGCVVVECKALAHEMTNEEVAQVITYLCATGNPVGFLLNFGRERLEHKRVFPPRKTELWKQRIRRYVWLPPSLRSVNPLNSVDSQSPNSEVAR